MKPLVIIPTYNELENVPLVTEQVFQAAPNVNILIVDDNSPDGTAELVKKMGATNPRLHLLSRERKNGLGGAYIAGFQWGLERGFDAFVQMDADLSHSPKDVPRLLKALDTHDLAIGSRYIDGGGTSGWSLSRKIISKAGNVYAHTVLNVPYQDMTGGFTAIRKIFLEKLGFSKIHSRGYVFQVELKYRAHQLGLKVVEVPILFSERLHGVSKMSGSIVKEAALRVIKIRNSPVP